MDMDLDAVFSDNLSIIFTCDNKQYKMYTGTVVQR